MSKIKIAILGYGNLGKGMEIAVKEQEDMTLVGIFSRRDPSSLNTETPAYHVDELEDFVGKIDVLLLAGGSATDLPEQTPQVVAHFNTVDSYDNHGEIPNYFAKVDQVAKANNTVATISTGWDPGLFSMNRLLAEAILPNGQTHTFWGKGLSQGHSDAVRRVEGVKNGVQYTIPSEDAMAKVYAGQGQDLQTRDKHNRVVYVVLEAGADADKVAETIKTMPNYFADYHTEVNFISEEELKRDHQGMPHGGHVIRYGQTSDQTDQVIDFSLSLSSNPEFTAAVNVAFARATYKMVQDKGYGAKTVFDFPLTYLSPEDPAKLRRTLL